MLILCRARAGLRYIRDFETIYPTQFIAAGAIQSRRPKVLADAACPKRLDEGSMRFPAVLRQDPRRQCSRHLELHEDPGKKGALPHRISTAAPSEVRRCTLEPMQTRYAQVDQGILGP